MPVTGPIFILGMLPRSGTNHVWDLLGLHPDTELSTPVYEDHLVRSSGHLVDFVDEVSREWTPEWDVPATAPSELLASIGDGILAWLTGDSDRRIVTKMPSVEGAARFRALFPRSPLVVLVRDGRSLCESGVRTFGWSYERAFRRWRDAADTVLDLTTAAHADPHVAVIRFEHLVERPAEVVRSICQTVGLDPDAFPYDRIGGLPVRGSSTLSTAGGTVHWAPVEKTASFTPVERWESWSPHLHRRFAAVAGEQQRALGYGLVEPGGSDTVAERASTARDYLFDARYRELARFLGRVRRQVRRIGERR